MKSKGLVSATLTMALLCLSKACFANEEFETWKKNQSSDFNSYLSAEQSAFKKALESEWESFLLSQPEQLYEQPKLDEPPIAKDTPDEKKEDNQEPNIPPPLIDTPEPSQPQQNPASPPVAPDYEDIAYLGKIYQLPKISLSYLPLSAEAIDISNAWESLYPDIMKVVSHISEASETKALSDWGLISLLDLYSESQSDGDENGQKLLLWALLMELGFDCRIAYNQTSLFVLMPSLQKIFGKAALNIDGRDFYILKGGSPEGSLYTHTTTLDKPKSFDFSFHNQPAVHEFSSQAKTLYDAHSGLAVTYQSYSQLASYYRYHPSLDFVWYFRAQPSGRHYESLVADLERELEGLSELSKVNKLLSLVQHGFEYLRDDEQWGEEYYATPMHTLMLDAVDCEDRSFLFAFLVEQVVGLKTVGLKYPGHLAVAVELNENHPNPEADYVDVDGHKFYVSDPTYIGASVGQAMTIFDGIAPSVIDKNI